MRAWWKPILFTAVLLIFLIWTIGCGWLSHKSDDISQICGIALDSAMSADDNLNDKMKYIALDLSEVQDISGEQKIALLKYMKKYDIEVMEASLDRLKRIGLFHEAAGLDGVLLKVKTIRYETKDRVIIKCSKYRSPMGQLEITCTIKYSSGEWMLDSLQKPVMR